MKKLFFSLLAMFAVTAAQATSLIGIRADNDKETFTLSNVLSITFQNGINPTMSVNQNDGLSSTGFKKVLFSDEPNKVEDVNSKSILVYPNPVESIIYIDGLNSDADIQILDLKGKTLLQQKAQQINVTNLLKGTYLLKINNQSIKFIKK
jgi:hypothetical protein